MAGDVTQQMAWYCRGHEGGERGREHGGHARARRPRCRPLQLIVRGLGTRWSHCFGIGAIGLVGQSTGGEVSLQ